MTQSCGKRDLADSVVAGDFIQLCPGTRIDFSNLH